MSLLALALFVPATTALEPRVAPERLKPATAPLATGPAATSSTDSAPSNHAVYREDRVMVRAADVARLDAIASRHGASVARPAGQAGVAALSVPAGISADAFVAALDRDPEVLTAAREGRFYGASTPPASASWHMTSISRPAQDNTLSSHIVAVLDTGVAYENYTANGKTYVRASGMNNVTIVAPLDLVENDGHPNDDHQHGTHIASLIVSKGAIPGVAAGAKLMPIKVLDSTNSGSELDLIDALAHAVTNGADVINLSLAFPLGYAPSVELQEALHDAWAADVVMVAAAGNDGADELAWPAASPLVISVGSVRSNATNGTHLAAYSNRGPGLDVVAPGGSLDLDVNGDGWADGVVAQTISLGNPGTISWVLYQGTSQSAALVSGTVLRMLKDGDAPDTIRARLQTGAFSAPNLLSSGSGSPRLNVTSARASTASGGRYTAGAMGFVRRFTVNGQVEIEPTLRVVAMDPTGARLDAGEVVVRIVDEDGVRWDSCTVGVGDGGMCEIVAGRYTDPAVSPDAWIYTVAAVVDGGVGHRPTRALFASDAGEAILAAVEAANVDPDRSLAVYWPQGVDPELGSLHEAFSVTTTGSFLADAPVVTTFTRSHVATQITQENNVPLDLEGTGVITFPTEGWGFMAKQVDLDGGGVGGLGGRLSKLLFLNGSAYASGDLGWHGAHMFAYHDGVIAPNHDEVGVNGEVVDLFDPIVSGPLLGTHIAGLVTSGGRIAADGYEEAVALPAAGALTIGRLAGVATPTGAGEVSVWMMDDDNAE